MCNNIAIISTDGDAYDKLVNQFKLGLILGRSNGKRGTGFFHNNRRVRSKNGKSYYLDNHDSLEFVQSTNAWFFEPDNDYNIFMGHNRAPSTGMGTGDQFVHPFMYGEKGQRIIFQHNGTITNIRDLCTEYGVNFNNFRNDSMILGHLIHKGVDKVELFKAYRGACTCIWYDERDKTLNIFKGASDNKQDKTVAERPLYYYQDGDTYYFNSQEEILEVLHDNNDNMIIHDFPINTIVTIDQNLNWTEIDVDRVVPFIHPPKKKKKNHGSYGGYKPTSIYFTDHRAAKLQAIWYKGNYYYNRRLMHGHYKLDDEGRLTNDGKDYYFFNGLALKNKDCFDKSIQRGEVNNNWFHKKALSPYQLNGNARIYWMYGGRRFDNGTVNSGLFTTHAVTLRQGEIITANSCTNIAYKALYTITYADHANLIRNYNEHFGTEFTELRHCENDFKVRYGEVFSSYGYSTSFIVVINNLLDTENLYLDDYNKAMNSNFVTIEQAQDDFIERNNKSVGNTAVIEFYEALDMLNNTGSMDGLINQSNLYLDIINSNF